MDLTSSVSQLPFVGEAYQKKLEKLEITTIKDLLYHIPFRYLDFRNAKKIGELTPGEIVTIKGKVKSAHNAYTKMGKNIQLVKVEDSSGEIQIAWFNQPFLIKNFEVGETFSFAGEVSWFAKKLALFAPEYEKENTANIHTQGLIPIYSETKGVTSKWLRRRIADLLKKFDLKEYENLSEEILQKYELVHLNEAINSIHFPLTTQIVETARKRLAFDELLSLQVKSLTAKKLRQQNKVSFQLKLDLELQTKFEKSLPFSLTKSQKQVIQEIYADLENKIPMNRLLQGDVGSGKTIVAAFAILQAFANTRRAVLMAPTQILAQQHYQTFQKVFATFGLKIALVTATDKIDGEKEFDLYIGTHALLNKITHFTKISLVIIDEQHKFGVEQRQKLIGKKNPHILTMTATPIPRTVALTLYGDQEMSVLDELPTGRQKITTWIVPEEKRKKAYDWMREKIKQEKTQAFVICPLIEESETETLLEVKAANKEFENLQKVFPEFQLGLLHGRTKVQEKKIVLKNLQDNKINILVATPIIEVGIDIPNATIIVIETAERFGLAQLHQLRGRVGRGDKKAYCLLFTDSPSPRLEAIKEHSSGFKLAEIDLALRGPGELFGKNQHGLPELKIASWTDVDLIKKTRQLAEEIINAKIQTE